MALRDTYDFRVSVKELAGVMGGGPTVAGTPMGHGRLALGQRIHDAYRAQARRIYPGYRQEVTVRWHGEYRARRVLVEGRMDGLYEEAGRVVIQEIKSVMGPDAGVSKTDGQPDPPDQLDLEALLEDFPDPVMRAYRWQCALYCHFHALARAAQSPDPGEGVEEIAGELVLVDVRTMASERLVVDYDPEACVAFVDRRIQRLLDERVEAERLAVVRREVAAEVRFPFDEMRPHQEAFMENVAGAAEGGMGLLVSAPTGIGKTVAALVPMVQSCLGMDRRLMVVTAKVSQQELYLDTLEKLVPAGREIGVAQLEAKERSCPRREMHCSQHACSLLRRCLALEAMDPVGQRLLAGGVFRAAGLRELAAEHRLCPFEVGLLAAGLADVTVCDFNYAFHPLATLDRFFAPRGRDRVLLIDEAHNLPSRAQEFLSQTILRSRVRTLAEGAVHGGHPVFRRILEFLLDVDQMISEVERSVEEGPLRGVAVAEVFLDPDRVANLETAAETWLLDYLAYAKSGERRPPAFVPRTEPGSRRVIDPFINFCYDILHFCRAAEDRGDHMTSLLRRSTTDTELKIFCKDPARHLATRHRRFKAVVAMSATLEPLDFYADVLGISRLHNWTSCAFGSPFPKANRLLVVDTSVSTRYADRDAALPEVCQRIGRLVAHRPGNYLAFFPSYALLGAAELFLQTVRPRIQVVSQQPGAGAAPLLKAFADAASGRADPDSPETRSLVGCAVIGGALAEGVDFAGELACGAFVFGPALPAVTEERKLMQEYYQREMDAGFEYAFMYPGLARVVQAAGRVIRGPRERGVIVLYGQRFAEPRYRELLPAYWQAEALDREDPESDVIRFWEQDS
jgi:DNA excision repair protein ERCC-2